MGLKTFIIEFSELKSKESLRLWIPFVLPKSKYKYDKINNFLNTCDSGTRPKGGIKEEDIGEAISLGGEQIGKDGSLELSKIPYVSFDFYENSTKGKVKDNDILICKDGALTGKTCLVDFSLFPSNEVMVNEHVYILRGNAEINQSFLFYYTKTNIFQSQVKDLAYKKKAQPGLNTDHFKKIKIPLIPKIQQDQIVARIEPIENNIKEIKKQITPPQEAINKVFSREFKFNLEEVKKVEEIKYFTITNDISFRNRKLRTSVRWEKIAPIQNVLYQNTDCIEKLGKYIKSTKNGWSPNCKESDSNYSVFGVNSISKTGNIVFDEVKFSDESRSDIENYFAKENDFFVSRGNTVDLVALASVVKNISEDIDYIFPDLFIKVEVDESIINKEYLAFVFNSIIGRSYFKYSAKGKNQTMVKVSGEELNNFYLPIPKIDIQQKIAGEIKVELEKQEDIINKIEIERKKIDKIIDAAIK